MIRTIIVDDEIDSIRVLERLLENKCPNIEIIGKADGVESALQLIKLSRPDLVLLDIEMTQGNAFDLLNQLQPITFQVIFVTAFDNYATRAFKYSALDYLLKPVDADDLQQAVVRATARLREKETAEQMRVLLENLGNSPAAPQKIAFPTQTGFIFASIHDIVRMEAKGSYTNIYLSNKDVILTTRTVSEYEGLLPSNLFYRVHNSHIINLQKIEKYQKGRGGFITMEDGSYIEVATRRREEFLQRFLK